LAPAAGFGKRTSLDTTSPPPNGSSKLGDTAWRSWLRNFSASTVQTTRCTPVEGLTPCAMLCAIGRTAARNSAPIAESAAMAAGANSGTWSCGRSCGEELGEDFGVGFGDER